MIPSIFLSLFFIATVIFIVNSHYRWTYFFAIALFVLLFSSMFAITGQWQRGLNFASVLFVVLMLFHRMKIHYYKQPLLISDFWLVTDWRNWETLLHYKGAIFGVLGLLGLLGLCYLWLVRCGNCLYWIPRICSNTRCNELWSNVALF